MSRLDGSVGDKELISAFRYYGKVKSAYVIKDCQSGMSLRFGYVVFKDVKAAESVLRS